MKRTLLSSTVAIALLGAGFAMNGVACGASSANEASGTLSAAVTTVGPDGATYALPSGTKLSLINAANASENFSVAVDGSGATESYELPAGTYSATLSTVTTLLRTGDAGPSTAVPATLSDAQPYQVIVNAGTTTALTFHFAIAGTGENLTFSTGSVSTNVVVSTTGGSSTGVGSTFQVTLSPGGSSTTINGYATGALQGTMTFAITGAFVPSVDQVCAPVGSLVLANVVDNGYAYNVLEGAGTTGYVCFATQNSSNNEVNVLPIGFDGQTTWSGNFAFVLSNGTTTADEILVTGNTSQPVFDGTTLNLSSIAGPTPFTAYSDLFWYGEGTGTVSGAATIQLLP